MSVASFTLADASRQFDLEALQTVAANSLQLFPLELTATGKSTTRRLTGLQKLVQRYALLFLQFKGSVKYAPTQGTSFLPAAFAGYIQTAEHVTHQFIFANVAVIDQLRFDDTDPAFGSVPPDDERIADASLLDFYIDRQNARLLLRVSITNLAGANTSFVLPTN